MFNRYCYSKALLLISIVLANNLSVYSKSALTERQTFAPADFVFDLFNSKPNVRGTGGTGQRVAIEEMPALEGLGVSSVIFRILPCGINLPHVHPRGTELFHVLEGKFLTGFLEENSGRYIEHNVTQGQVTVFPQGLIHFEQNLECTNATFLSAFSSEDPGVLQIMNRLFEINGEALTSTFNQAEAAIDFMRMSLGTNPAKGRGECLKRCGLV